MGCFKKIKKALEQKKNIKVKQEGDYILIFDGGKLLTRYNLIFVEYSNSNLEGFIDYWKYKLNIKEPKRKKVRNV